jgi:hypothetical protein
MLEQEKSFCEANRAAAGGGPAYMLANSGYKGDSDYYLYYLGYVKNVPIAYKTQYQYDGITPITITFEKNWVNEETITQSTTETVEKTSMFHIEGNITVGVASEAGAIIAKAKNSFSVSISWGGEWSTAISTEDTLETATTKAAGESESITATIGEHGEEAGTYRYALFGVTDFYVLYKVNKTTRAVEEATVTTCARASTYAWGIDFDPNAIPEFGKTGGGDLFEVPDIDFTDEPPLTNELEEETVNTPYKNTTMPLSVSATGASVISGQNLMIAGSQNGVNTDWKFEVKSMNLINERTIAGAGAIFWQGCQSPFLG